MPKVIINDEELDAADGELLLDIARRNGSHIGFACNGNGICTTCECRVTAGADKLSPFSEAENDWLPQSRKDQGYRLGCQAVVEVNEGATAEPLAVITRAEEIRRMFLGIFRPAEGENVVSNYIKFIAYSVNVTALHVLRMPFGMSGSISRNGLFKTVIPWENTDAFIQDGNRMISKMVGTRKETVTEVKVENAD